MIGFSVELFGWEIEKQEQFEYWQVDTESADTLVAGRDGRARKNALSRSRLNAGITPTNTPDAHE